MPWQALTEAGHEVVLATPRGRAATCDPDMLTGVLLGAVKITRESAPAYEAMTADAAYGSPLTFDAIVPDEFHAVVLPGGHGQGMKPHLESGPLQAAVAAFVAADKLLTARWPGHASGFAAELVAMLAED